MLQQLEREREREIAFYFGSDSIIKHWQHLISEG